MQPEPLVSVVIPTFNRAPLLAEALRSVLAQTHTRIEVLVVDDGSTDDTAAVLRGVPDPRVRYEWQPNAGRPAPARNRGIRSASGDLVAFIDDDDLWEPVLLERVVAALAAHPDVLLVSGNGHYLPRREHPIFRRRHDEHPSFAEMLVQNAVITSGTVARRELVERIGPFDESPELRAVEDLDWWLRTLRHRERSIITLAEPLVHYRVHGGAISLPGSRAELERIRVVFAKHTDRPEVARAFETRRRRVARRELHERFHAG